MQQCPKIALPLETGNINAFIELLEKGITDESLIVQKFKPAALDAKRIFEPKKFRVDYLLKELDRYKKLLQQL